MADESRTISGTEAAIAPAADPWARRLVDWKDRLTWLPALEQWLEPRWRSGGKAALREDGELDLCWDDTDWLDVLNKGLDTGADDAIEALTDSFDRAVLRAYHGCRVLDAGVFHREGLRINDPADLEAEVRGIVAEEDELAWMRSGLDEQIAGFDARERDTGRLYLCVDERPQLDHAGHYLLYGSEWVQSVLGWAAHPVLRRRGVPTVIEVDLPFKWATPETRRAFAAKLLQEWTRVFVNGPTFVPELDFTVILSFDVPADRVVGHHHPAVVKDPFRSYQPERTRHPVCPHCATQPAT